MSPRRSSRARTSGPAPQHTSSNSSHSQNRPERSTRSHNKSETSSGQRSESGDQSPNEQGDSLATRRSKRGLDIDNEDNVPTAPDDEDDEEAEAEEVTRCICGFTDYPGPPLIARDSAQKGAKNGVKEENGTQPQPGGDGVPEDTAGNFFIQCDKCQVWQHGGCVGLMDESMSPDEYYCEECKPSLHKTLRGPNGSKSTRYLPVLEATSSPASSTASSETQKKEAKQKAKELSTRRRATMNSRDAAYDEEEMMRRAIEESKMTSGTLGKRGRDESEEKPNPSSKRMRTSSGSPKPKESPSPSQPVSEDEDDSRTSTNGTSRKARDSPPPSPSLSPTKAEAKTTALSAQKPAPPDTPSSHRPSSSNNHKKLGRPAARRGRMRNQYTRDSHLNGEDSPSRDRSRDVQGSPHGAAGQSNGDSGRPSRPKYLNPNRTSLNEMKRRVAGIIEFVSRLQTESPSSHTYGGRGANTPNGTTGTTVNGSSSNTSGNASPSSNGEYSSKKGYRELNSTEMMEELMRGALNWQTSYGKYGEK
ncbi:putative transcriptional regulator [Phaeomoniella chlamydospora]|uniref:Putative transcriptional regulator n=1 Tax=Phaeomoniella chlamydospora TaxID=158046 RepID=A0A0G2GQY4_PHACM|nr:putative transcriptional regulator [Phaeomoniella chlamydospora]